MTQDRTVGWAGLVNGRDLGGLATGDGRPIQRLKLVRSASPHTLSPAGWRQLADAGVRTIIDLRHDREIAETPIRDVDRPTSVAHVVVPMEPPGYIGAWSARGDRWKLGTPLYYGEFLATNGGRVVSVLNAVAEAPPGGVLLHCGSGRDRAGLAVAMLLDLLGVDHQTIVDDHWLSYDRPVPIEVEMGKQSTLAARPLSREDHADALHFILRQQPAIGCYDNRPASEAARERLAERLVSAR